MEKGVVQKRCGAAALPQVALDVDATLRTPCGRWGNFHGRRNGPRSFADPSLFDGERGALRRYRWN